MKSRGIFSIQKAFNLCDRMVESLWEKLNAYCLEKQFVIMRVIMIVKNLKRIMLVNVFFI